MKDQKTYTGNNHERFADGSGFVSLSNPSFKLVDHDGKNWDVEWHYYFGPSALCKDGEVKKTQPGMKSRFWKIATLWHEQGCKVINGIGQWSEKD